jgi:succinate-acetate transporter protein
VDGPEDQGRGAAGPGELSGGVEGAARIVLRPIGNPLPLGFLALAGGTLVLSGLQLGWFQEEEGREVALVIIAFVVPLQLVASVFGYLGRDVVAGTAMGVLAGTWLSIGLITLTGKPGTTSDPLGVLLLLASVAMTIPATAAASGKVVPAVVLATTALRFAATGLFQITAAGTWEDVAGIVGLVLCGLAVYAAAAMAIEDAGGQTVLPLGRRGAGATSVGGPFGDQLRGIEREAGVRGQL